MFNLKGGRVKGGGWQTAPYETCMVRTPRPIKNQVEELIEKYRKFINDGGDPSNPPSFGNQNNLQSQIDQQDTELNLLHALNGDLNLQIQELELKLSKLINKPVYELEVVEEKPVYELEVVEEKPVYELEVVEEKPVYELEVVEEKPVYELEVVEEKPVYELEVVEEKPVYELEVVEEKPVYELEVVEEKPVYELEPLKAIELGKRLGYKDHSYVIRIKLKSDFTDWSRVKDPDHISWKYDPESKLFYPIS